MGGVRPNASENGQISPSTTVRAARRASKGFNPFRREYSIMDVMGLAREIDRSISDRQG
jgi:hypothetical protein